MSEKIKIAIVDILGLSYDGSTVYRHGLGGSESAVSLISAELHKLGFDVTVYNNCLDSRATEGVHEGVRYLDRSHMTGAETCDIFIASRTVEPYTVDLYRSLRESAKLRVLWMHDTFCAGDNLIEEMVVGGKIDEIFTLSDFHTSYVTNCDHGRRRNFEVLKNHIFQTRNGIHRWIDEVDIKAKDPNLFVYNSSVTKGMIPLVNDIWPAFHKKHREARLHIIGGYYRFNDTAEPDEQEKTFRAMAQKEIVGVGHGITFHGVIPQKQIADILAKASFFLCPGAFPETFGISALEALNYHVPVIATRFGALEETAVELASYHIDYAIEPNVYRQDLIKEDQVHKFLAQMEYAYTTPFVRQQKMQYCHTLRDISEWDTVALQWKQHFYRKLGLHLPVEEFRRVSRINEKVQRVFGRRFTNIEDRLLPKTRRYTDIDETRFVIISPFYNAEQYIEACIRSVAAQDYDNYTHVLIDDASTDDGFAVAERTIASLGNIAHRFKLIRNAVNCGAVCNQVTAMRAAMSGVRYDSIPEFMLLDGDDSLRNDPNILERYHELYDSDKAAFTYGSSWSLADNIPLIAQPYPEHIKKERAYRSYKFPWGMPFTHLRSFRGHLIRDTPDEKFKDADGNWFRAGGDNALFYELIERADPDKVLALQDIVYNYNDRNPLNDYKVNGKEQNATATAISGPEKISLTSLILPPKIAVAPPQSKKKILIAVPSDRYIESDLFEIVYNDLIVPQGVTTKFKRFFGFSIAQIRNLIADWSVKQGFDYTLCLDSDIIMPPDTLKKLLSHEKGIVGALYIQKNEWIDIPEVFGPNPGGGVTQVSIDSLVPLGLQKVSAIGFGCVLVNNDVFRKMPYPQFNYIQTSPSADDKNNIISEDVTFCQNASKIGYETFVDSSIICGHRGEKTYYPTGKRAIVAPTHTPEQQRLLDLGAQRLIPQPHLDYLHRMRKEFKIEPKVIYDIGACVLHWTTLAKEVWPVSQIVVFEAMQATEFMYQERGLPYACVALGAEDGVEREFWENTFHPGGNSFYAENPALSDGPRTIFTPDKKVIKKIYTLDFMVNHFKFPLPDLIKIDCQGAEMEILKGAQKSLENCNDLILELQETDYNLGAPKADEVIAYVESLGFKLITPKFSGNHNDADYHFSRRTL